MFDLLLTSLRRCHAVSADAGRSGAEGRGELALRADDGQRPAVPVRISVTVNFSTR